MNQSYCFKIYGKKIGQIGGSHDFQSRWINFIANYFKSYGKCKIFLMAVYMMFKYGNFIASKFMAKKLGEIGGSHDFQNKWINSIAICFKFYGKCKIFLMALYMIFKHSKRFSFAPSFNKPCWNSKLMGIHLAHNIRILKIKLKKIFFASWLCSVKFAFFSMSFYGKWAWCPPDHATPFSFWLQIAEIKSFLLMYCLFLY